MFKNIIKEEIEVPAQMTYLGQIRDFIEKIGKKYKYSEKVINSFKLVVDEAATNIIRHGYRDVKGGTIRIRAIVRRRSLTIVLIDRGRSFDPRTVSPPDLKRYVEIGKKGGLGIFMMRKLMDDIRYNITPQGNELRLTKLRDIESQGKIERFVSQLSMKTKYTAISMAIIALIGLLFYFATYPKVNENATHQVYEATIALTKNLAQYAYDPLFNINNPEYFDARLNLFQAAKSIKDANPELIYQVFILDSAHNVLATGRAIDVLNFEKVELDSLTQVESDTLDRVEIYKFQKDSLNLVLFSRPIFMPGNELSPIGYAVTAVTQDFINKKIAQRKRNIFLILLSILLFGIVFSYLLISKIVKPFQSLAEWVRLVGQGKADEDEIDIDASDELGEIAQAFNEMTNKFKEAQINLIEQQRLQKELQVAQEIQQMLLPQDFPNVEGFDIASYYEAAKEVGGDLFDFVEVDENSIGICVADVSGKGVPGSLIMTMIRTALRLEARGNKNPADVLSRVNRFVTDDMKKGMFVTMFYIILDSRERVLSFASAGHNPMILYRGKTKKTYYLNPSGFPVGIKLPDISLFDKTISYDRIQLHPDDLVIVYTDGVTEAMNPKRELYSEERFLNAIRKYGNYDVVDFIHNIKDDIKHFTGGFEQSDDITIVAIKENLKAEEVKLKMLKELFVTVENNNLTVQEACDKLGVSTSTYYKYKKIYENRGEDGLLESLHSYTDIESTHLSIEEKTKLYEVIRQHPSWGPKRIAKELYSPEYGYTMIEPRKIYIELVRAKLNTKEARLKFVQRGGKKRLKAPGTPLLTLDGKVILAEEQMEKSSSDVFVPNFSSSRKNEIILAKSSKSLKQKEKTIEKQTESQGEEINRKPSETKKNKIQPTMKTPEKKVVSGTRKDGKQEIPAKKTAKPFDIRTMSKEEIRKRLKNPEDRKEIFRQLQELKSQKKLNKV
jgi:serine phosphatase RsbU (regulator of sigma subunit)/anti-sigma regulatory factor (Ser/Thr protein kinase)/transposase